ncbi:MAG: methyltransferase domain-containing protein [Desulfobacterales bacterium]|nr:methyltransferase domain-containing protein [Desulfobacterales bacterium]
MRKLNIGGKYNCQGWEIIDAIKNTHVDHVGNAKNLSRFEDKTFTAVYASHVLEHFDYEGEIELVLKEWFRVLAPGGKLYISVPDLDVLANLFLDRENLSVNERFFVMRIMFGGHVNEYDFHLTGLNRDILEMFLRGAGFTNIIKVDDFGFFKDSSTRLYKGTPISINLIGEKPM